MALLGKFFEKSEKICEKQAFRRKNRDSNRFLCSVLPLATLRSKWHQASTGDILHTICEIRIKNTVSRRFFGNFV